MSTPWNSIAESIVPNDDGMTLNVIQAMESPCMSCQTSPCCTHLPLNTFKVTNLLELDHARYLLNFDRIELGISASGEWGSYYTYPCRFLSRDTYRCTVHNTPQQPTICVNYNPYNCWYRRAFNVGQNEQFVRIDHGRFEFLLDFIELNDDREIVSVPSWDDLVALMATYEDQDRPNPPEPEPVDEATRTWEQLVLAPNGNGSQPPEPVGYADLTNPCAGCAAYCCTTLVFPQSRPQHVSNLDYYRFCLGFPGVELGISDGTWSVIVRTTCRHLTEERLCGIFDAPERPLICRYYDGWKCDYKVQFGQPRPDGFLRIRLEHFPWLTECLAFDHNGAVADIAPTEAIRQHVEMRWQETGSLPTLPLKST